MNLHFWLKSERELEHPLHFHEFWEVLLNVEGEGILTVGGENYNFGPGTIACIRPGVAHGKRARDGFCDWGVLIEDFCFQHEPDDVLLFQDDGSVRQLFQLAAAHPAESPEDLFLEQYLRSLADAIQNLLSHWKSITDVSPAVRQIQKRLSDNAFNPDFALSAAFEGLPYSPNHLRKLFKESCGATPVQYRNQRRIQRAKELLLRHRAAHSIKEIAAECGFSDPYYFSRVFKQIVGVGPTQFCAQSRERDGRQLASDDRKPEGGGA